MSSEAKPRVILSPGKGPIPDFPKGTKVTFDFKTVKRGENGEEIVIDDSKKYKKPMELLIGKEFKLQVWEECVKTMRVGEISKFNVHKSLVVNYPFVAQAYRKFANKKENESEEENHHVSRRCCGLSAAKTNYADLDDLIENPSDLEFTIELLKVENPSEYEKEIWQMEESERLESIPKFREEGNKLYKQKRYEEASQKYASALGIIEQLMSKEKPGESEWNEFDRMKIPLLSNYSQCKLLLGDYYSVIENCTEVIKRDPTNTKAYFRRAKAHSKVWNVEEAKSDFFKVIELDKSLEATVRKELRDLKTAVKEKTEKEKQLIPLKHAKFLIWIIDKHFDIVEIISSFSLTKMKNV
ncbi:AH receptor-interacting protein-like protein [Dinothrombium tinctorium]|uniref:AH receptor-interacting protein-like protein n=1 Tax=Dinothrombium tinctorium TaxID=1965070 RepID=A0A443QI21_9ACAR|nr:AH receptor-interacting protein-like protein [Dinothrombium tinctorium]